ncbi:MAG: hypothetical protein F6K40_25320 [Okeania sp. SIO3I5]|uniref:hypothetical protein n=1 Tax=Okeania sp. SIO3I5 TaxID=2607805 RepID=UPI0013BA3D93|nr:hypothetical protein [Okeania sp. SIO3I5]NEQ39394.1 hypothetical protein [Okeania sp. SIO3I5]
MTNKFISFISAFSLVLPINLALVRTHGAYCLIQNSGELKPCEVTIDTDAGTLDVEFRKKEFQDANFTLKKNDITEISTGQYAKSQVQKSVAKGILSPLGGIISAIDKQARVQVAILYWDKGNNQNVTVVDVRSRDALLFRTDLELMTGLEIKR